MQASSFFAAAKTLWVKACARRCQLALVAH